MLAVHTILQAVELAEDIGLALVLEQLDLLVWAAVELEEEQIQMDQMEQLILAAEAAEEDLILLEIGKEAIIGQEALVLL
jgi:hypothetical protein